VRCESPNSHFVGVFPQSRKPPISFVVCLRLSVFPQVSARLPLDRIFVKFVTRGFYWNRSRKSRFWFKWVTLHDDLGTCILLTAVRNILYLGDSVNMETQEYSALLFQWPLNSFILLTATWLNNTKWANFCVFNEYFQIFFYDVYSNLCNSAVYRRWFVVVSMVTMVTRIRHIVALHVHCLCVILHISLIWRLSD
jgi:hypothetical protein